MTEDQGVDHNVNEDESLDESELDPALVIPSPRIYRGSLIALLIGSIFAIWLLVFPPDGTDQDNPPNSISAIVSTPQPTPIAAPSPVPSPTPAATSTVPETPVPTTSPTPSPTITPSHTPTVTAAPAATAAPTATTVPSTLTYTVVLGDTMFWIAERFLPDGEDLNTFIDEIAKFNGIVDVMQIQAGQTLEIPRQ